jgi:hypothetical protein
MFQLPIGKRDGQPITTGIESEETVVSIHFALALNCSVS